MIRRKLSRKIMILVLLLLCGPSTSFATELCAYYAPDIGQIIGKGETSELAFADAAEKCFDLRMGQGARRPQKPVTSEQGEAIIDACANIKCEKI